MTRRLLPLAALALVACGSLPLPEQRLADVTVSAPVPLAASGQVLYQTTNAFSRSIPASVQRVSVTGQLSFSGSSGEKSLAFFITDALPQGCTALPLVPYLLCPDAAGGQQIGTASVSAGQPVPLRLSGPALDAAAHAGRGYLGVQLTSGTVLPGDTLSFTALRAGAFD